MNRALYLSSLIPAGFTMVTAVKGVLFAMVNWENALTADNRIVTANRKAVEACRKATLKSGKSVRARLGSETADRANVVSHMDHEIMDNSRSSSILN